MCPPQLQLKPEVGQGYGVGKSRVVCADPPGQNKYNFTVFFPLCNSVLFL